VALHWKQHVYSYNSDLFLHSIFEDHDSTVVPGPRYLRTVVATMLFIAASRGFPAIARLSCIS